MENSKFYMQINSYGERRKGDIGLYIQMYKDLYTLEDRIHHWYKNNKDWHYMKNLKIKRVL